MAFKLHFLIVLFQPLILVTFLDVSGLGVYL